MAATKISDLPSATIVNDADIFPIVQSGTTKKATAEKLRDGFATDADLAAEVSARTAADSTESSTRASADSAEASTRGAADSALGSAITDVASDLADHIGDTANPHNVTAAQLGLGDAAAATIGTGPGTVAAGDDARLSDARTPTTHEGSHLPGGSDPIAIGAFLPSGNGTLVAGTLVVSTVKATATARIFLTRRAVGGTLGDLSEDFASRVAGTSFTVKSYVPGTTNTVAADTSVFSWMILEP